MPRIPVHTPEDAPNDSREALNRLARRFGGKVMNIHGEMAHSPAVLNGYVAIQDAIRDHGTFDPQTREAVALAVGAVDQCDYCQAAHTAGARAVGMEDDDILAARSGAAGASAQVDALLAIVRAYTSDVGNVPDELWNAGLAAGWSDAQLAEVSIHVTVNMLTNYFNHYVHTDLDLPAAPPL